MRYDAFNNSRRLRNALNCVTLAKEDGANTEGLHQVNKEILDFIHPDLVWIELKLVQVIKELSMWETAVDPHPHIAKFKAKRKGL